MQQSKSTGTGQHLIVWHHQHSRSLGRTPRIRVQMSAPNPEHVHTAPCMQTGPNTTGTTLSTTPSPTPSTLSLAHHTSQDIVDMTSTHSHRRPGRGSGTSCCHTGASAELCQHRHIGCEEGRCSQECPQPLFQALPSELHHRTSAHLGSRNSHCQDTATEQLRCPRGGDKPPFSLDMTHRHLQMVPGPLS